MKTAKPFLVLAGILSLFPVQRAISQATEPARPQYITVTTMHWNMDYEDFDMDAWKSVEKEYFDKVTSRNELVVSSGYYTHRFTPDNREILLVNAYANWEDLDKVNARNQELIEEAWPDEASRKAYFQKRNAYYGDFHSDEIYAPLDHAIVHDRKTAPILLVRRTYLKFPKDGDWSDLTGHMKEVSAHIFKKNEHIKGYYPNRHAWGSDNTEIVEAFFVDSMAALDAMFDRNGELFEDHWPDEASRKEVSDLRNRFLTGVHGDYIYTVVSELIK